MNELIYPVALLGGLGAVFGAGLIYASSIFAIKVDPKQEEVAALLPGVNCGSCGFAGCSAFAAALVKGEAEIHQCPVSNEEIVKQIAHALGIEASTREKQVAFVFCQGSKENAVDKYEYVGERNCVSAMLIAKGAKACPAGCLGLGTCKAECPFDAIRMGDNGLPIINNNKCTSCGKCIEACPKKIIKLVPISKGVHNSCSSHQKGKAVKDVCKVGCIACQLCVKTCPVEAIKMDNDLAVIDYEKCIMCGLCAKTCPTKSIVDKYPHPVAHIISDKCTGCSLCKKVCPVNAPDGELKQVFKIDVSKCIGCGLCVPKCPKDAIEMKYERNAGDSPAR